ncbi:hypothetical protein RRG08_057025 [Elysia crispata]|uniref:Uncharacterized protein n=1 Tax=Elysia crispata TaxID=231223 RepID=A0AAE0Z800_9GAST|nr:hypothetical protein RRG08_057025 [Elysia crispata]
MSSLLHLLNPFSLCPPFLYLLLNPFSLCPSLMIILGPRSCQSTFPSLPCTYRCAFSCAESCSARPSQAVNVDCSSSYPKPDTAGCATSHLAETDIS